MMSVAVTLWFFTDLRIHQNRHPPTRIAGNRRDAMLPREGEFFFQLSIAGEEKATTLRALQRQIELDLGDAKASGVSDLIDVIPQPGDSSLGQSRARRRGRVIGERARAAATSPGRVEARPVHGSK